MKLSVTTKTSALLCFISVCAATSVRGQQCSNAAGRITCTEDRQESCEVTPDHKFEGRCFDPNEKMLMNADQDEGDAAYASQVLGRTVTKQELQNDPKLRHGLNTGQIQTNDGRLIMFTPVGEVRNRIANRARPSTVDESALRSSLELSKKKVGRKQAIQQYLSLLNNPLVKTPNILDELATELLNDKEYADAIELLELNAKIKGEASAFFALGRAYHAKFDAQGQVEDREKAMANYQRVLTIEPANANLRAESIKQTGTLKGIP